MRKLSSRWHGQELRIDAIIKAIISNQDWTVYLIEHTSHSFGKLTLVDDGLVYRFPTEAAPRDLRGITLNDKNLSDVENLSETAFDYSNLKDVKLCSSNLKASSFKNAKLDSVEFIRASLQHADFTKAIMTQVNFSGANMNNALIYDAVLINSILFVSDIQGIQYNAEPSLGYLLRLFGVKKGTRISGNLFNINKERFIEIDDSFLDFLNEQKRIDKINKSGKLFAHLYYVLTNYGRDFKRLGSWIFFTWVLFGFIYARYPIPSFLEECRPCAKILNFLSPSIDWGSSGHSSWINPYYFSITTLLTLTFGDMKPEDWKSKVFVSIEALLGYIFLGMFISMIVSYANSDSSE